jgi:plasmid maintenance system antidote protein VapI
MDIEELLWFRGKKRGQIAAALGISQPYFSNICTGKAALPFACVMPLAEILQTTPGAIVEAFAAVGKGGNEEKTDGL